MGQTQPFVSTLNSIDGRVKAVAAIVPAGTNGAVCFFVTHDTELVLDIDGYFVPAATSASLSFYPVTPCRLVDTRLATGTLGGPSLVGGTIRMFPLLSSACNSCALESLLLTTLRCRKAFSVSDHLASGTNTALCLNSQCTYRRGHGKCSDCAVRSQWSISCYLSHRIQTW